jgi:cytidylate kinase
VKDQTREHPQIVAAAERRMREWSLGQETAQRARQSRRIDQPHAQLGQYITISREAGAGGSEIAQRAAQALGWEVLDAKLVDCVAERSQLPRWVLELVDETEPNWAYDVLGAWLDRQIIPHQKYVVCLTRVILAAARRGNVVLVGRGANLLLPRSQGLAVRIIASEEYRLRHLMQEHGFAEAEARRYMAEVDRGRRDFVMRFFHHDIADPHLFDLVIQADRFGPDGAAEAIVAAYRQARGTGARAEQPLQG